MLAPVEEMMEQGETSLVKLEQEVLIHSQVRRIKQEDDKARELLQRLQLLEIRPATDFRATARQLASTSVPAPSPLRRAGQAISVGD
ncbi:hypothetical protein GUJ93_ZPchr0010g9205 [Zizania palustris]|uniref:Uncharacterized protein n=1 Tax=Zizania palustris TaxID=103762 RepID=A0A8J6BFT1_ZIZPA|nr:hypothetical protein GUJ93_ZPchr0010g9205 [Zizania palustris]